MGGAASHFSDTNWETADGGVKDASATLDGAQPTATHSILYITKKQSLVNQRDCEIRDEDSALVYVTAATEGTTKDFDLLDQHGTRLFHIHTDQAVNHSQWTIYSYFASTGSFVGQTPATMEKTKGLKVEDPLYLKASVTIAWDKYHGVISLYEVSSDDPQGTVSKDHLLRIEEIKSITPQFQSFVPQLSVLHPQLCGYWLREHTVKTDRTKMHLAKGTDIALHCILAVIANIVHVERQADDS